MPEGGIERSGDKTELFNGAESALGLPQEKAAQAREVIESLPARELKWIIASTDSQQAIERFKKSLTPQEIKELFAE